MSDYYFFIFQKKKLLINIIYTNASDKNKPILLCISQSNLNRKYTFKRNIRKILYKVYF